MPSGWGCCTSPSPHYHADYYAAFVIDTDGHNVEVVCHRPAG